MSEDLTQKIIDLEIRLAEQELTIDSLSDTVHQQWRLLDKLTGQYTQLNNRFTTMEDDMQDILPTEPAPPHY